MAAKVPIASPSRASIQAKNELTDQRGRAGGVTGSASFQDATITAGVRITVSSTSVRPMPSTPSA